MLTFIFIILMLGVFGKLIGVAIKAAWGITMVLFAIVLLPIILIGMVISGLVTFAIPILVIIGLVTVVKSLRAR